MDDWKELRKKSKAQGLRAQINKLELQRRAIQAKQLELTREAEALNVDGAKPGTDGEVVLTSKPLILQEHPSKHAVAKSGMVPEKEDNHAENCCEHH